MEEKEREDDTGGEGGEVNRQNEEMPVERKE